MDPLDKLIADVNQNIVNPLIALLFSVALIYFLVGLAKFVFKASDESERTAGKQHMLWGVIGMFIMFSVWAIARIIINSFGIDPSVIGQ
jgi:hypothetical protein